MNAVVDAEIKKQQLLLKRRAYYDKNAERIRARQLGYYYKRKAEAKTAGDAQTERRGRKAKPREIVITVTPDDGVRVA